MRAVDIASIAAVIVLLAVALAVVAASQSKARVQTLESIAARLDARFTRKAVELLNEEFCKLPLFNIETSSARQPGMSNFYALKGGDEFTNMMRGGAFGESLYFDYTYTMPVKGRMVFVCQTVSAFKTRRLLPPLAIWPAQIAGTMNAPENYQPLVFPEHPDFSSAYRMKSATPKEAKAFLTPEAASIFSLRRGWSLEAGGNWVVLYRHGQQITAENYPAFIDETREAAASVNVL